MVTFCWGKILQKCSEDLSCGGSFHDTTQMFLIKSYRCYFCEEGNIAKKDENYLHSKISTFYSTSILKYKHGIGNISDGLIHDYANKHDK